MGEIGGIGFEQVSLIQPDKLQYARDYPWSSPILNGVITQKQPCQEGYWQTQIQDCPKEAHTAIEFQLGLFSLYGKDNVFLGTCMQPVDASYDHIISTHIQPIEEMVEQYPMLFPEPVINDDLLAYLKDASTFFGKGSAWQEQSDIVIQPTLIPIEFTYHLWSLLHAHPEMEPAVYDFISGKGQDSMNPELRLSSFLLVKNPEEFRQLQLFAKKDPFDYEGMTDCLMNVYIDVENAPFSSVSDMQREQFRSHLMVLARNVGRSVMHKSEDPQYPWEGARAAIMSLTSMASNSDVLEDMAKETADYSNKNIQDPHALALILPTIEARFFRDIQTHKDMTYQDAATLFYEALGEHLNITASETTGDTTQELCRMFRVMDWARQKEIIGTSLAIADFGSGNRKRLLEPFVKELEKAGITFDAVTAVDLQKFPEPAQEHWKQIQGDFSDPRIVEDIGKEQINIAWCMWSPLNDVGFSDQVQSLQNFSSVVKDNGLVIVDVPVSYGNNVVVSRAFETEQKKDVKKEFTITGVAEFIAMANSSGLRLVNSPERDGDDFLPAYWYTGKGMERATLVFQKMKEAIPVPHWPLKDHQVFVGSSKERMPS